MKKNKKKVSIIDILALIATIGVLVLTVLNIITMYKESKQKKTQSSVEYSVGEIVTLTTGSDQVSKWRVIQDSNFTDFTIVLLKETNINDKTYEFDSNNSQNYESSSIKKLIDIYGSGLSLDANLQEIRLITTNELDYLGCDSSKSTCESAPSWVYTTNYWTMTPSLEYNQYVWAVSYTKFVNDYASGLDNAFGIRPVILVSKSIIK